MGDREKRNRNVARDVERLKKLRLRSNLPPALKARVEELHIGVLSLAPSEISDEVREYLSSTVSTGDETSRERGERIKAERRGLPERNAEIIEFVRMMVVAFVRKRGRDYGARQYAYQMAAEKFSLKVPQISKIYKTWTVSSGPDET